MKFRNEWKHEINYSDMLAIRHRLKAICKPDPNAIDGKYFIRSLYFDNLSDKALCEKINGINMREKFRIRYYNNDTSHIKLEKKSNYDGLKTKQNVNLTKEEVQSILDGETNWMINSKNPLICELYSKMKSQGLRPKTIVEYMREPFIYPAGNVRVAIDYNIRTGIMYTDFFNENCVTIPAGAAQAILEVKWNEFLPSLIRDAVQLDGRCTASFSKYATCRIYG